MVASRTPSATASIALEAPPGAAFAAAPAGDPAGPVDEELLAGADVERIAEDLLGGERGHREGGRGLPAGTPRFPAVTAAIAGLGIPAWLSYTIEGERTRAGQSLPEAFAVAAGVPQIVAVGVNCCTPSDVPAAIAAAPEATGKPVIVYPNSGEGWDARRRAWTGQSRYSAVQPRQWMTAGARITGGCCRVRPAYIAVIAEAAADAGDATADGG